MATKPVSNYGWALNGSALRTNPTTKIQNYGWTTLNNLSSGTPEKPSLEYENGWKYIIYQWLDYLEDKTDEVVGIPTTGQSVGYYLKTNGSSVFTWASITEIPTSGQVAGYFLKTNGASTFTWDTFRKVPSITLIGYVLTQIGVSSYNWSTINTSGTSTATMTPGSGTITLSSSGDNNSIIWNRVGNIMTINAKLVVASVSSPSGTLTIPTIVSGKTAPYGAVFSVSTSSFGAPNIEYGIIAYTNQGNGNINIKQFDGGQGLNIASSVQAGTTFYISGSFTVSP